MDKKPGCAARGSKFQQDILNLANVVGINVDKMWLRAITREQRIKVYNGLKARVGNGKHG
jgi:hypothetical protein